MSKDLIRVREKVFPHFFDYICNYSFYTNERWSFHDEAIQMLVELLSAYSYRHYHWGDILTAMKKRIPPGGEGAMGAYAEEYQSFMDNIKELHLDQAKQIFENVPRLGYYITVLFEEEATVRALKKLTIPPTTTKCDNCRRKAAVQCPICAQYLCSKHFGAFWSLLKYGGCVYCKRANRIPSNVKVLWDGIQYGDDPDNLATQFWVFGGGMRMINEVSFGIRDLSPMWQELHDYMQEAVALADPEIVAGYRDSLNVQIGKFREALERKLF